MAVKNIQPQMIAEIQIYVPDSTHSIMEIYNFELTVSCSEKIEPLGAFLSIYLLIATRLGEPSFLPIYQFLLPHG